MFVSEFSFYLFVQSLLVDMMHLAFKGIRAPINSTKDLTSMFINCKDGTYTVCDSVCFSVEGEQYHFRDIPKYGNSHYPENLDRRVIIESPRVSPI